MIHSLTINIDDEKIEIRSVSGSILTSVPNIVALDENDKFASIGETAETIQERVPKEWEQLKDKIHFCNLFSPDNFRSQLAASAIDYLAYMATHPSPESHKSWRKDTVELQVNVPHYEKLNPSIQELFEYHVQATGLVKVNSLSINNQQKSLKKFRVFERVLRIGEPATTAMMFFVLAFLAKFSFGKQFSTPIPKDKELLFFIGFIAFIGFLIYFTGFIFVALWKFASRNYVSSSISKSMVERNKIGLPKFMMNLIWQDTSAK